LRIESTLQENVDIDFYVGCGHKWLGGPETLGFVRIGGSTIDGCPRCAQFLMSGDSLTDAGGVALHYQGGQIGTQQRGIAAGMKVALEEIGSTPVDLGVRHARILKAADQLRTALSAEAGITLLGPPTEMRSGIVAFAIDNDLGDRSEALESRLGRSGYVTAR
jgi:selenocysteine lyase/cysteine desulfurase